MANPLNFRDEFDLLATDGAIGSPYGLPAYAYMRVSSSGQADEGRSGLPRQLRNIHEAALRNGNRITWDMIFADDHSGFEFNDRPELSRLRKEYTGKNRRAHVIIMEYLDRLSRNADWHQGFLLDEMKRYGVVPIFWKDFNSRIERAVMGAISQDGMEQAKQRMMEGNLHKARDGRVTARTPAYGFRLVDSHGHTGENAKKDSHYALHPDEAPVVKYIFERIASGEVSVRGLAMELNGKYPPPKKMSEWETRMIIVIIHNPVYKGEFIAHRWIEEKVPKHDRDGLYVGPTQYTKRRRARPEEEWITVPVPSIVSVHLWETANRVLDMNKKTSPRNGKNQYLLGGLVKCATCGSSYTGTSRVKKTQSRDGVKEYLCSLYRCNANSARLPVAKARLNCNQRSISQRILESKIWSMVYTVLLEPQILIDALDREYYGEGNARLKAQIEYLVKSIADLDEDDKALWRAYRAKVFDEEEYKSRRDELKESKVKNQTQLENLRSQLVPPEVYEEKKRYIHSICKAAKDSGLTEDAPYETKRRIIRLMIDKITLNVNEGWVKLEGSLSGLYYLWGEDGKPRMADDEGGPSGGGEPIMGNPKGRGSSPPPSGNWPGRSASLARARW